MTIALLAALCMVFQDILGVCMVQAEARNHGLIAGLCDAGMWLFGLISIGSALNHHGGERWLIIAFVSAANIIGSILGVRIGKKFIK